MKKIIKKTALITTLLIFTNSFSQTVYRCFKSDNNQNLQIQMKIVNNIGVSVKYKGQKSNIPIRFQKENGLDRGFEQIYHEVSNGKITGNYTLTHTGINEYLLYNNWNKAREYNFSLDLEKSYPKNKERAIPCF